MICRLTLAVLILALCAPVLAHAGPLHDAAMAGDIAQIELLLSQGADVNEKSGSPPPLYFAINTEHVEAAELLIARGADVNARSTFGAPLHAAAARGLTSIVNLLLEHGADTEVRAQGLTPLHLAARNGRIEVVQSLLDHGADINAVTKLDEPALHLALAFGHADVANLLLERGTKAPPVEPIEPLLASADPARGDKLALPCKGCHSTERAANKKNALPLWGIVGRPKASVEGFKYSAALVALTGEWSYADLNRYIAQPAWTAPGLAMKMEGIHGVQDRADIIAFLRTLSDSPPPLPSTMP